METLFAIMGVLAIAGLFWGGLAMISFKTHDVMSSLDQAHREREATLTDDRGNPLPDRLEEYNRVQTAHKKQSHDVDMLGVYGIVILIVLVMVIVTVNYPSQ